MKILTSWLRELLPGIPVDDTALAADLTLRGIAVDGVFPADPQSRTAGSIFEMDITTNRVDAMNHYGVAREAALIYGLPLPALSAELANVTAADLFPVQVEEPQACGRFTARVLRGVTIRDSQKDVQQKFAALGVKAINNAVDASNSVLQQMGQPTHAFDLDKIAGGKIVVRLARAGEKLVTLDDVERTLSPEDLVIADADKAISLAGVLGGWETMITPQTRNILVEAAWFDPDCIRRSARRHGLHTDASHRFERGADFAAPPLASALVCQMILRDGGDLHGELTDVRSQPAERLTESRPPVALRMSEVRRILGETLEGADLTADTVQRILAGVGCKLSQHGNEELSVQLPSWRLDLSREIDLIEEIARVHGYNRFAGTLPAFRGAVAELPGSAQETALRETLLGAGWYESVSSTFCSVTEGERFAEQPKSNVAMGNPLSQEAGILRPSLLPEMVAMLAHNLNNGADGARLFELGTVFTGSPERVDERQSLAIGLTGAVDATALFNADAASFFALKGLVESLLARFQISASSFDAPGAKDAHLQPQWLEPGRAAHVVANGVTLGWLGQLAAAHAEAQKLRRTVYLCELALDRLFRAPLRSPSVREISRFPAVARDFSFVFADDVPWQQIASAIQATGIAEMTGFLPREIFRDAKGVNVPAGHYSLLVSVGFQSSERTLTEAELQEFSDRIVTALTAIGGVLRG